MTKRLIGLAASAALLIGLQGSPASAATTAHSQTATVSCSGGTGYTVDANALFGQQTETTVWNTVNSFGSVCGVALDPP